MTSINPISPVGISPVGISPVGTDPNQPVDTTLQSRMQQAMAPVASLFGETPDQLMSELSSSNTSLSALAAQKGISQTDLENAIKSGLQTTASSNGQTLSDTQLTNIADRIANHRHGGHHHHGGGGQITTWPNLPPSSPTGPSPESPTAADSSNATE